MTHYIIESASGWWSSYHKRWTSRGDATHYASMMSAYYDMEIHHINGQVVPV